MLTITKSQNNDSLTLAIAGRLDTVTSPELEKEIRALRGVQTLILDMSALDYISSAGLRVLMMAHKLMGAQGGSLKIHGVNQVVMEVFDVTGFSDILDIV